MSCLFSFITTVAGFGKKQVVHVCHDFPEFDATHFDTLVTKPSWKISSNVFWRHYYKNFTFSSSSFEEKVGRNSKRMCPFSRQTGFVTSLLLSQSSQYLKTNLNLSQLMPTWKKRQWAVNRGLIVLTFHWTEQIWSLKYFRLHWDRRVSRATPLKTAPLGPRPVVPHS